MNSELRKEAGNAFKRVGNVINVISDLAPRGTYTALPKSLEGKRNKATKMIKEVVDHATDHKLNLDVLRNMDFRPKALGGPQANKMLKLQVKHAEGNPHREAVAAALRALLERNGRF